MLRFARHLLLRVLVALVVAAGVALSLVDVRAQAPGITPGAVPPAEPAATIERLQEGAGVSIPGISAGRGTDWAPRGLKARR